MTISLRLAGALLFLSSIHTLSATPLLFVNYNPAQTQFAQTRAEALGLSYSTIADYTSASQLAGKSVVVMPGFSSYSSLLSQVSILSDFVRAGGYLWLNVAGGGCATDFAPGGVDFLQYSCGGSYNQSEQIVNPAHAYVQGSFDPRAKQLTAADFMNWNVVDLGHVSGLPANPTVITANPQGATLAEYSYGQGWVVVSTLTYGWGDNGARGNPMDNMLLYAAGQIRSQGAPGGSGVDAPEPGTLLLMFSAVLYSATMLRKRHA